MCVRDSVFPSLFDPRCTGRVLDLKHPPNGDGAKCIMRRIAAFHDLLCARLVTIVPVVRKGLHVHCAVSRARSERRRGRTGSRLMSEGSIHIFLFDFFFFTSLV